MNLPKEFLKVLGTALLLLVGLFGVAIWPLAAGVHYLSPVVLWVTIPWVFSWYIALYYWYADKEIVTRPGTKKTGVSHPDK